jgi:tRNA 2-thiouridine synthesizing protein A
VALLIDALGRKCPIPIIWAAQRIGEVPIGGIIGVLADDPAAYTDIPSWCAMKSHELVSRDPHSPGGWHFQIRRQY